MYKFITFKCLKWFIATFFFCYNLSTQNSDENLKHFRYQWKSKKKNINATNFLLWHTWNTFEIFFCSRTVDAQFWVTAKYQYRFYPEIHLLLLDQSFLFNTFRRVIYWIFVPSSAMYVLCTCISMKVTVLHWIYIEIGKMADS